MPAIAWKSFRTPKPDRDYLMVLSFLPLRHWWRIPQLVLHLVHIAGQLRHADGLIGYSLLARPLAKTFYTLSVWRDEAALSAFVRTAPHARTMDIMPHHMGQSRFVKRPIKGHEIPPSWDDALRL